MLDTDATATAPTAALETFIEATTDALASLGADETTLTAVNAAGDELVDAVTAQQEQLTDLETRVETLEADLKTERETRAKEAAEDRKRVHELETQLEAETCDDSSDTAASDLEGDSTASTPRVQPPETPLEDVIRVPEHLVEESLTANQRRARFVAKDIHEYSKSVPAGRAIRSSELRRVLAAGEETQIYTETVSRVIRFLDELGGDAVNVRETQRGERVVVVTDAFVERVQAYNHANQTSNTVVTGQEVSG